jgi:hypothetical protein
MNVLVQAFRDMFPTLGAKRFQLGHDKLLHVLEGRRGRGKSYVLADLVLRLAAQRVPIVTNTSSVDYYRIALLLVARRDFDTLESALAWLHGNVTFAQSWDDVLEVYDGVVLFDEATLLFDGRRGMGVPVPSVLYEWFKQSRKVRATVYFVVHSLEWLDVRIRQNVDLFWMVRKELPKKPTEFAPDGTPLPLGFWLYGKDPGGVGKVDDVGRSSADLVSWVPFDVRVAQSYHSWELIQELQGEPRFPDMAAIREHHEAAGHEFGILGRELLAAHLERIRGPERPPRASASAAVPVDRSRATN